MRPDHFQFFIVCSYWNKRNESMNRSCTHGEKSDSFNMVAVIKRRHDREPRQVFFFGSLLAIACFNRFSMFIQPLCQYQ